jgi:hypothetical protein
MSTKKATKKAAKKKPAKKPATLSARRLVIADNGTISPDPLEKVKHGSLIKLATSGKVCFDIQLIIKVVPCEGGGGPITIHS